MGDVKCFDCVKRFSQRKHLYAHMRNIHKKEPTFSNRSNNSIICACCSNIVKSYADLRDHMVGDHNIDIFKEEITFKNKNDFLLWKNEKEKEMKCFYLKPSGVKKHSIHKKEYYICHRSYIPKKYKHATLSFNKRKKKAQSLKMACSCPSTIELVEKDGQHKATMFFPHFGHEFTLKHLNLSAIKRTQIDKTKINNKQVESQAFKLEHSQMLAAEFKLQIQMKLDLLYSNINKNTYDHSTLLKLVKILDSALDIVNTKHISLKETLREPTCKNAAKQRQFESSEKKHESSTIPLKKPTSSKQDNLKGVKSQLDIVKTIMYDHNYVVYEV